jgi:hypothetical protein
MNRMKTMKKFNRLLLKSAPLLLLPVMGTTMATDVTVPLSFTTLPAIQIDEIRPLAFGDVLSLTQADTCIMSVSAGTAVTSNQEGVNLNQALHGTVSAVSAGELSGACAGADDGEVGIYEITSFADAALTVEVTLGTTNDIGFTPSGYVTNLVEGSPGSSSRETISVGVGNDASVNASAGLTPFAAAGTNRAIIGGTITNFVPLTAGAPYATDFNLNVVYQ